MYTIDPVIFKTQFGFRNTVSAEHALIRIQKQVNEGLNNGKSTTIVSVMFPPHNMLMTPPFK